MTIIIKGDNDYDYDSIPHLKLAGNPPSGKESRRTRRMLELRKRRVDYEWTTINNRNEN